MPANASSASEAQIEKAGNRRQKSRRQPVGANLVFALLPPMGSVGANLVLTPRVLEVFALVTNSRQQVLDLSLSIFISGSYIVFCTSEYKQKTVSSNLSRYN